MAEEFEVRGVVYRINAMDLFDQWELYKHITPILPAVHGADAAISLRGKLETPQFTRLLMPLVTAGDADLSSVVAACVKACERFSDGEWVSFSKSDLDAASLIGMITTVAAIIIGPTLAFERTKFASTASSVDYQPITMASGMGWLLRPWLRDKCTWSEMKNGIVSLVDLMIMSDCLDVSDENEARALKAAETSSKSKR